MADDSDILISGFKGGLTNVSVSDIEDGTDGELITWGADGVATTVAAGTSAQVLTSNGAGAAPTFQNAASGGGDLVLLSTQTVSAANEVEFIDVIDSTYDRYIIVGNEIGSGTQQQALHGQFSFDNGSTYSSSAYYGYHNRAYLRTTTTVTAAAANTQTKFITPLVLANTSGWTGDISFELIRSELGVNNDATKINYLGINGGYNANAGGDGGVIYKPTNNTPGANITGMKLYAASGTISGTFVIYGIAKS